MTPYATKAEMVERFGEQELIELTDRNGTAGAIVDSVLDAALADASADIDGYLGGRYPLPLAVVPKVLNRHACDLARYYLYDNRLDDTHPAARRYKAAIRLLEQVAAGKVQLGLDAEGEALDTHDQAEMESQPTVFSREQSKGFI